MPGPKKSNQKMNRIVICYEREHDVDPDNSISMEKGDLKDLLENLDKLNLGTPDKDLKTAIQNFLNASIIYEDDKTGIAAIAIREEITSNDPEPELKRYKEQYGEDEVDKYYEECRSTKVFHRVDQEFNDFVDEWANRVTSDIESKS